MPRSGQHSIVNLFFPVEFTYTWVEIFHTLGASGIDIHRWWAGLCTDKDICYSDSMFLSDQHACLCIVAAGKTA